MLASLLYFLVFPGRYVQAAPVETPAQAAEAPPVTATTVSLPEGKFKTAGIATGDSIVDYVVGHDLTAWSRLPVPGSAERSRLRSPPFAGSAFFCF